MNNIHIDLDEKIVNFVYEKTNKNIKEQIEKIVCFALEEQNILVNDVYICIDSVSKEEIRKINKQYRNIDSVTDVLSFPIFDANEINDIIAQDNENKKLKEIELGDIIICLPIVEEHSIEYGTGILREMLYMITHGVAHLLGFDHIQTEDKKNMRTFEEKILSKIGVDNING